MSRDQLLWSELSPCFDIDTVTICNTKETLGIAHHSIHTLIHRIDQTNAWYEGRIGTGYSMNGIGALSVE